MVALAVPAQASLIVSDTFSRDDGLLGGSSPEVGAGTWNTTADWNINSGEAASPGGESSAFIPIGHVTPGHTYTFTADARNALGDGWGSWAGLAFAQTKTSTFIPWADGVYGMRVDSGQLEIWETTGDFPYKATPAFGDFTVPNQFKLVLDTTSSAAWSIEYFLNGSEIYTSTEAPSLDINFVMLNSNNDGVSTSIFDNVLVTDISSVPEVSSSFTMLGLISSGLLLRRRTKRSR